ncbi:MAG: hypothetical protein RRY65_00105 [Pseudoflavonifractor sp.]
MKTSCEFRFGFWDVTARADAAFAVSQNQDYAKITDINLEDGFHTRPVATLEPGFGWPLDGSKEWLPDNAGADSWGWWSTELSGADRAFVHPPTLTVTFTENHSSAGITLDFYATLPGAVNIKWYSLRGALLADATFTPDAFSYFCDKQVEDYGKVVITVQSMQFPKRFLRVTSILFGVLEVIGDPRVTQAEMTEEISPVTLTLPINTLDVSFFTPGGRFALLDPQGAYKMFQWKQELTTYKTVDGVRTEMGTYYLQNASGTVDAITQLACVDMIGILDTLEYKGGIYAAKPLHAMLGEILTPEGIPFVVDAAFNGVTISGYLPICTKRAALQQIAFAIGAVVDPTRGEVLRFYPAPTAVTADIKPARKVIGHKITLEELVTQVDVTAHKYTLSGELKELTKTTLGVGVHTIPFTAPVSVTKATGAVLTTTHPNYCVVTVATAGEVILSGYAYLDAATIHTVRIDPLPAGAKTSIKPFSTATLVSPDKAPAVAQRLYDYYQNRYTDEGRVLPGCEVAAEKATISSLGGRAVTGHIGRVVTDLAGGCIETVTMRGK